MGRRWWWWAGKMQGGFKMCCICCIWRCNKCNRCNTFQISSPWRNLFSVRTLNCLLCSIWIITNLKRGPSIFLTFPLSSVLPPPFLSLPLLYLMKCLSHSLIHQPLSRKLQVVASSTRLAPSPHLSRRRHMPFSAPGSPLWHQSALLQGLSTHLSRRGHMPFPAPGSPLWHHSALLQGLRTHAEPLRCATVPLCHGTSALAPRAPLSW